MTSPRAQQWLRFLLGGGINTAFTYGIYLALSLVMGYQWAYLLAYALGVVFAYWFNAVRVFRVPLSWKGFFAYPLVYVIQYSSSALLLGLLVEFTKMSEKLAPLLVTICMVPLTYAISKFVLVWSNNSKFTVDWLSKGMWHIKKVERNVERKLDTVDFLSPLSLWNVIRTDWKWWLSGAIFSFELASLLMTGWPSGLLPNLNYPYVYSGDGLSHSWLIQRLIENWVFDNSRSGYPFGSNFLDYPGSDSGNYLILKLIGLITGKYYSALNLYFLLGFSVTFIASFCVLRTVGLAIPFAFSAATLFNFLPFHFQRLEHLFYTWYFVVPIFYYLTLRIFNSTFNEKIKTSIPKKILYAFCLISLGSFGVYYALFGVIMLFAVSVSAMISKYNPVPLKLAFLVSCFIILGVLLNLTPNLMYRYTNGPNPEVVHRSPFEAEVYGLKFVQLVLPRLGHRKANLGKISEKYSESFPLVNENMTSSLGIVGSLGLLGLLFIIFSAVSGKQYNETLRVIALIVLVLFMFGTIGGFGSIFSQVISSSIRGWNRISVFIGFGALLGLFIFVQAGLQKYFSGRQFAFLSSSAAIIFLLSGLYDQTVPVCKTCNEQTKKSFQLDKEFIRSIEDSLPEGSSVYQLPYMPFPEVLPLYRLQAYDLAAGFLHSTSLHWSFAGMKGRGGDLFYRSLAKEPIKRQLEVIKRLGFAGIYIDRRGFGDNGQSIIDNLTAFLGTPPALIRPDGKVVFFRLNQESRVNFEGLSAEQIMQKAGYIADNLGAHYSATFSEGIDFTRKDFPIFVKDVRGLSEPEPWGRWSDANLAPSVSIDLREQLPSRFNLVFSGQPFGPNFNQNLMVRIGSQIHYFKMSSRLFEYHKAIDLGSEKVTHIEFLPAQPASPRQLGISADSRRLGIGLVYLRFSE